MDPKEAKNIRNTVLIVALIIGGVYYYFRDPSVRPITPAENTQVDNSLTTSSTKVSVDSKQDVPPATSSQYIETNSSCKLKAEGVLNSSWIRTCYLRGLLTAQCQQLFDADGYHKNFPAVGDPNWSEKFGQIITDTTACECQLPVDVTASLRGTQQISNSMCDKFYPK